MRTSCFYSTRTGHGFLQRSFTFLFSLVLLTSSEAQDDKFAQLYDLLPTPNTYRTASGAPGQAYWQQRADYEMDIVLDDATQTISGNATITYFNFSPDPLPYLWMQLDQNIRAHDSDKALIDKNGFNSYTSEERLERQLRSFEGGFTIHSVEDGLGKALPYNINKTMMRVDLSSPLLPGKSLEFRISWSYPVQERAKFGGRSGFEYFSDDGNYLYTIAQFFPRMAVYSDLEGWQNKQFLGRGEFTLPFGNYNVRITVPSDHLVAATGTLQNPRQVLSKTQLERFALAKQSFDTPVLIVTEAEAIQQEASRSNTTNTWHFKADNVRDFAFASSRKFIWDAMAVPFGDRVVMAMSMYPKEGNPLWEMYSTKAVAHTLKWFSHYTFDYPYPVAWSIHTNRIGMEYPMISFNGGRPNADGTYSERTKYGLISVIIHEVGHNYFPMIINSDERQWAWMDEGLNSFVQFLTEQQWERDYPSRRGPAHKIVHYMASNKPDLSPIMTNAESDLSLGNNAYAKTATALNILRETIMGRKLFDHALKTYANRWKFKHPYPADFFRTMEDASAIDLDWFWRGWFFSTDHVDISLDSIRVFSVDDTISNPNPASAYYLARNPNGISSERNRQSIAQTQDEIDPSLRDSISEKRQASYRNILQSNHEQENTPVLSVEKNITGPFHYELSFTNKGGLVMPLILEFQYADNTREEIRIPAEIWLRSKGSVSKIFRTEKPLVKVIVDPKFETADTDTENNIFPREEPLNRFRIFMQQNESSESGGRNNRS